MEKCKYHVGIDLGTTYSSVSYLDRHHKSLSVPNAEGELLTPSVVYFGDNGTQPVVGRDARELGLNRPDRYVAHAKRFLGTDLVLIEANGYEFSPADILSLILQKLVQDAERELGEINDAVITVPAHFTGHQRQLIIQAGRQAGLETVNVVNEPVAAALAYVLGDIELSDDAEVMKLLEYKSTILIYDLGGGTFDLSIVQYDKDHLRVLGASGEERLGGIDWDEELVNMVIEQMAAVNRDLLSEPDTLNRLIHRVEKVKEALTRQEHTELLVQGNGWQETAKLSRKDFERRTRPLVLRTRDRTESLLRSCGLKWKDINFMLPVGGASQMPMIRSAVDNWAWHNNFVQETSPNLSIARGAALFAGMIQKGSVPKGTGLASQFLANYSTTNVCSNSLALVVHDTRGKQKKHVLIPSNTPLPASHNLSVYTRRDDQRRVSIRIVEGSGSGAKVLCKCTIDDLPEGLPVQSPVDVNVSYDADGLLSVVAKHSDSGRLATVGVQYTV